MGTGLARGNVVCLVQAPASRMGMLPAGPGQGTAACLAHGHAPVSRMHGVPAPMHVTHAADQGPMHETQA